MSDLLTFLGAIAIAFGAHYVTPWMWLAVPGAIVVMGITRGIAEAVYAGIASERSGSPTSRDRT